MPARILGSITLFFGLGLSASCGSCDGDEADEAWSAECPSRIALMQTRFEALGNATFARAPDDMAPVSAPFAPSSETSELLPVLELRDATLVLDGRELDGIEAVAADLATLDRNWGILHPRRDPPHAVNVWVDANATIGAHRATLLVIAETHTLYLLARATRSEPTRPPLPAPLAGGGERSTRVVDALREATEGCPQLSEAVRDLLASGAGRTTNEIGGDLRGVALAIAPSCNCYAIDLEAIEYTLLNLHPSSAIEVVQLELAPVLIERAADGQTFGELFENR